MKIPKLDRYSIGVKIETDIFELMTLALIIRREKSVNKLILIHKMDIVAERLKFLIRIIWEEKVLPDKKYVLLSQRLVEMGKILGSKIKKETAPLCRAES